MSLSGIPNQPVIFDQSNGICPLGTWPYSQLLNPSDTTEFQLLQSICEFSPNEIVDNDFSNPGVSWSFGANWVFQTGGSTSRAIKLQGSTSSLFQTGVFVVGKRYTIVIDCLVINLAGGSDGFQITDGVQTIGYLTASGISRFYFDAQGTDFYITATQANDTASFESASAFELQKNVILVIVNSDGTILDSFNPIDNPLVFEWVKDRVNIKVDWNDISLPAEAKCVHIGLCDPCISTNGQNGLINGDFEQYSSYWSTTTLQANAIIDYMLLNNQVSLTWASTTPSTDEAVVENTITALGNGLTYSITVNFGGITMSAGVIVVTVYCGTASDSVNVNAGDAHTSWSTSVVSNGTTFSVGIESVPAGSGARKLAIESIDISVPESQLVSNLDTNDFNVGEHDCSIVVNMNSHQDAMGFVWDEGNFNPRLRLGARLAPHTEPYSIERKFHIDSNGTASNYFFIRRKTWVLPVFNEPLFIHDFLSLLLGIEHFFVDNEEYFMQEDEYPQIVWNRERTLGKVELLVGAKTQDIDYRQTKANTKGGEGLENIRVTSNDSIRITSNGDERKTS